MGVVRGREAGEPIHKNVINKNSSKLFDILGNFGFFHSCTVF